MSPSTRRAWIEIAWYKVQYGNQTGVALHPEGVDRNDQYRKRRKDALVALHPEGVDRNSARPDTLAVLPNRRPPPGGRG